MKIGIYGGSFNPPHLGHMAAARAAIEALELDRLLLVPACDPPHKELPEGSASPAQRLEMTTLMADQISSAECWDVEVAREGVSYTVDTLEEARRLWPEAELWLLVGTDMFLSLQNWRNPRRIMELAGICAFQRDNADAQQAFSAQKDYLQLTYGGNVTTISIPDLVEVSSTEIRNGLSSEESGNFLSLPVWGYILRKGLYGTCVDMKNLSIDQLRAISYSMVKAKRIPHIRGTEEAAVALAQRWGADPEKMRRAAILHDCTKYASLEEHLAICERFGIELDEMERSAEKLLHSKSGAALAKYMFGQDDEIFTAILYHTTGRGDMTLAEKIIYLADYMEPCRTFPGVEELRLLAETDLDRAVLMGVRMSIQEMLERNRAVHPNTLQAEQALLKGLDNK